MLQLASTNIGKPSQVSIRHRGQGAGVVTRLLAIVAKQASEVGRDFQPTSPLLQEQERFLERSRILRDMHDGVGSHICTAIHQLQSGKASCQDVLLTLHDSLDQLKLSIDALSLSAGDVNALLANLRYRLEPRFASCNVQWGWDVETLETIELSDGLTDQQWVSGSPLARRIASRPMDNNAMRQLQFMLMEALSNVLQHSKASKLCIEARRLGQKKRGVSLQIIDNGCGFDVDQSVQRGLLVMKKRAEAIGAVLRVTSQPGRTVVKIAIQ